MQYIQKLAELIANITESYTSVIFINNNYLSWKFNRASSLEENTFRIAGYHTLSNDFNSECEITPGSGLVGWSLENAKKISVCPFERDSTTLLYYKKDQALKSFITIPIISKPVDGSELPPEVIGVIACDSKKSYAFPKITEKILLEASELLLQYLKTADYKEKNSSKEIEAKVENSIISQIKKMTNEQELLQSASSLTKDAINCDALAIVTSPTTLHSAKFYCSEKDQKIQHNLMELALKHKKALCSNKSIQTKSTINKNARSFLSVPFKVMDKDAGSFNFLSNPGTPFSAKQVQVIEDIAKNTGESLEKIRLKQRAKAFSNNENLVSWNHFATIAKEQIAKATHNKEELSLSRITIGNLEQIEDLIGIAKTQDLLASIFRIIQQLIRYPAISCKLLGTDILILAEKAEALSINHRLIKLLSKLDKPEIARMIADQIKISTATTTIDGSSFNELIRKVQFSKETKSNQIQKKATA